MFGIFLGERWFVTIAKKITMKSREYCRQVQMGTIANKLFEEDLQIVLSSVGYGMP